MIERYAFVSARIRQGLNHLEQIVQHAERITQLVAEARPCHGRVRADLLAFADFLDQLAQSA